MIRGYFNGFKDIRNVYMEYENGNIFKGNLINMKAEG
jgi:hypothetical protein